MNDRKVTKRKGSKAEKNKGQGEVFVLPPNLLEELGIHLGSIETTPESTKEHQESDSLFRRKCVGEYSQLLTNNIENHHATTSDSEPSIIRTANLMKESVLLSPTFNLNNTTIQCELDVEENTHVDMKISKVDEYIVESFEITERGPKSLLPQPVSITDFENIGSAEVSISTQDMIKVDESNHVPVITYVDTKETLYDEHADEAYSSDCSNSQIDKADVLNNCNVQFSNESKINKNKKINIISEEIFDPTQFKKINECCSPKGNNLIPVTINTIIKTQYKNSICYGHSVNLCPDLITDCLKSSETFDGKINTSKTEIDDTLLNKHDNEIQKDPEIVKNSDKNEPEQLCAYAIQEHDKCITETCTVDSVDRIDLSKPDVLIETFNNPILPEVMVDKRNENDAFKNVNTISSDVKCDANEISSKYNSNENLTEAQHKEDEIRSISCDDHAEDNPSFVKIHNDSEYNIEEQNIKSKDTINKNSSHANTQKSSIQPKNNHAGHSDIHEKNENLKSDDEMFGESQNETCRDNKTQPIEKLGFAKNANDVDMDKVKEIAKYLSQFAEIKKQKANEMRNRNTAKKTLGKKHSAYSKLSIQGVEKPGGSIKTNEFEKIKDIRTYARKRKCTSTIPIVSEKYYDIPSKSIDLFGKNSPNDCNETESCLCSNFGQLISYDTENAPENICLCSKTTSICAPDIIFSIYYENSTVTTVKAENCYKDDDPTISYHENPMSKIMPFNNDGLISAVKREHDLDDVKMIHEINTPNIDDEMMTHTTVLKKQISKNRLDRTKNNDFKSKPRQIPSTSKQRRKSFLPLDGEPPSKKRGLGKKILSKCSEIEKEPQDGLGIHSTVITNDSVQDAVASAVENCLIKCGVCGRYMKSEDWFGHIELEHNYLAWKDGDRELDENKTEDVQRHLGDLMEEFGGLKCLKCGIIMNKLKYYMNHIDKCKGFTEPYHDSVLNTSSASSVRDIRMSTGDNASGETESFNSNIVKCGVCGESVTSEVWYSHIGSEHNYLAWKYGEASLDVNDTEAIREHLYALTKKLGGLKCAKCGVTRKYVKAFMNHIVSCDGLSESQNTSTLDNLDTSNISQAEPENSKQISTNIIVKKEAMSVNIELVKCGVCDESMCHTNWLSHIELHHYLAWKCGEPVLDVADDDAVRDHLYSITKELMGLKCAKCGVIRKYPKGFMSHIKSCGGSNESQNEAFDTSSNVAQTETVRNTRRSDRNSTAKNDAAPVNGGSIKCGVCNECMGREDWLLHIETRHYYLAWKDGEHAFDMNDDEAVHNHLNNLARRLGALKCWKCGLSRMYAKPYLKHIESCCARNQTSQDTFLEVESEHGSDSVINNEHENEAIVKCGVCNNTMRNKDWICHIRNEHNYMAWKCGENPLDVDDEKAVGNHLLNIIKKCGLLECSKCGITRKFVPSYLSHFSSCDGLNTQEDKDAENSTLYELVVDAESAASEVDEGLVKCGKCGQYMVAADWAAHLAATHNYLAWKSGDNPLDLNNPLKVQQHLKKILEKIGSLVCSKCGVRRKYANSYLEHIRSCDGCETSSSDLPLIDMSNSEVATEEVITPTSGPAPPTSECGVCGRIVQDSMWINHIVEQHDYLAWKEGEPSVDVNDKDQVLRHLKRIAKECGALTCKTCGKTKKFAKTYLQHIKRCGQVPKLSFDTSNVSVDTPNVSIDPANVSDNPANVSDDPANVSDDPANVSDDPANVLDDPTNLSDDPANVSDDPANVLDDPTNLSDDPANVSDDPANVLDDPTNLSDDPANVSDDPANVLDDPTNLSDDPANVSDDPANVSDDSANVSVDPANVSVDTANSTLDLNDSCVDFHSGVTCGVCSQSVEPSKWIHHTQKYHNYLAWKDGEKPWDIDDYTEVNEHLYVISKKMNGLACNKCGLVRKYVKTFLRHIKNCAGSDYDPGVEGIGPASGKDDYKCAMCHKSIKPSQWTKHAMKEHYNVTWIVGQTPIDIKNPYAVEKYLKEYRDRYGLDCNKCGASRASVAGFYAHIITCGKTEKEIEMYKNVCDICNNSYLCIYKNQHMAMHRAQEYSRERKLQKLEAQEHAKEEENEVELSGKRRAARKARSVIENYSNDLGKNTYKCESCDFGTEFEDEFKSHKCEKSSNEEDFSGDESSSEDEEPSGEEESSLMSGASDQEEPENKRFRQSVVATKVPRIPFQVTNRKSYLLQADKDFCNAHFTDETLFPQWRSCDCEMVPDCDLLKYFPPMEHSCKVRTSSDWITLKMFEALKDDGIIAFAGACIVRISWVPLRVADIESGADNFLAIACHNDVDVPRYRCHETPSHENLIQIWAYNAFKQLPKIVLGIAHDFGTVWSMDWCPSGARDPTPEGIEAGQSYRLGLLAVACSNGSAYIFSVPYPSTVVKDDKFIFKLKPVAELRMQMDSNRKLYQATAITWSKEKHHNIILVGYADGTTGYYDLSCDSPLLRKVENNVDVYYPYHDERPQVTCITATDIYPSELGGGATMTASATGAELGAARRGAAGGRARYPAVSHDAVFAPLWPAVMLAGDVAIMRTTVNELEWASPGRRCGGNSALAGCARCAHVAAAAPPTLRLLRSHPVHSEVTKQVIGLIELARIDKKKDKRVNDELAVKLEPLTYSDTVKIYGIDFRTVREDDKEAQQTLQAKPRAHYPERFPLADVRSMAFCPSRKCHHHLAIGTHSGLLFFINVAL